MIILIMGSRGGLLLFECCSIHMHPGKNHCHRTTRWTSTTHSVRVDPSSQLLCRDPSEKDVQIWDLRNRHGRSAGSRLWQVLMCVS